MNSFTISVHGPSVNISTETPHFHIRRRLSVFGRCLSQLNITEDSRTFCASLHTHSSEDLTVPVGEDSPGGTAGGWLRDGLRGARVSEVTSVVGVTLN